MKGWPIVLATALPLAALATHPQVPTTAVKSAAKPATMLMQAGELKWQDIPDLPGAQGVVLVGDPSKAGAHLIMRARFPDGFKIAPHWHPALENLTVLQGTFMLGMGDKWDDAKLKAYPTGTFYSEPKGTPHFVWAKDGEVIIQVTGMGPSGTALIPQK